MVESWGKRKVQKTIIQQFAITTLQKHFPEIHANQIE
jgi:hypothetical protein